MGFTEQRYHFLAMVMQCGTFFDVPECATAPCLLGNSSVCSVVRVEQQTVFRGRRILASVRDITTELSDGPHGDFGD